MNNFVFSQDPLLYQQMPQYQQQNDMDVKRQLDTILAQYQSLQQKQAPNPPSEHIPEDHIGILDEMVRTADPAVIESLNSNQEFIQINTWIQQTIQVEIMKSVKNSINSNPEVISKVSRAKDIIREVRAAQEAEDRKSLNELNDYITNYSDMTFNEYKQFKLSKQKK